MKIKTREFTLEITESDGRWSIHRKVDLDCDFSEDRYYATSRPFQGSKRRRSITYDSLTQLLYELHEDGIDKVCRKAVR